MLEMFTDGAARGNPGKGGFATVLIHPKKRLEIVKAYHHTTNNRMELMAVIAGLEALNKDGCNIKIYSDSRYVVDTIEKGWLFSWIKKSDFAKKKNPDLWTKFYKLYQKHHITMIWVKGHADHPLNNYCDLLATQAADNGPYLRDDFYENNTALFT